MKAHLTYVDAGTMPTPACKVPIRCLHLRSTVEDPDPNADARRLARIIGCSRCRLTLLTLREIDALALRAFDALRGAARC